MGLCGLKISRYGRSYNKIFTMREPLLHGMEIPIFGRDFNNSFTMTEPLLDGIWKTSVQETMLSSSDVASMTFSQ